MNDPLQSTTDVWGDNNPSNGIPPGFATDLLNGGDTLIVSNKVDVDATWPATRPLKYDGGDKIAATQAIAVTRTSWASGTGTLHGGSVEMLDTSVWGTRFDMPGDYTLNPTIQAPEYRDFGYAGLAVMASENGTNVYRNGTLVTTLNEGIVTFSEYWRHEQCGSQLHPDGRPDHHQYGASRSGECNGRHHCQ